MRFFEDTQKQQFFFSHSVNNFSSQKSFDCLLDHDDLLFFEVFSVIWVEILVALSLSFLGQFFDLSFLIVGSFEGPHNTLSSSFYFLNDSNGGFHIRIKSRPFFYYFFFRKISLFEVDEELLDNLVALSLVIIVIMDKISGNMHL